MSACRRITGVKINGYSFQPQHGHAAWQKRVCPVQPSGGLPHGGGIKMNRLRRGMNTGVGAPRRPNFNRRIGNRRQSRLQSILCATTTILRLPSAKIVAVIFHAKGKTRGHRRCYLSRPRMARLKSKTAAAYLKLLLYRVSA